MEPLTDAVAAPHVDVEEGDEDAEHRMMEIGLAHSYAGVWADAVPPTSTSSVLVAPTPDLLVAAAPAPAGASSAAPVQERCLAADTVLLVPFSFWPTEDKLSPQALAAQLLERRVEAADGASLAVWERAGLPREVAELSLHFRQLLGYSAPVAGPVQRLQLTDAARRFLFSEARLWADAKTGGYMGRRCEWRAVQLVIFPHGAVLSVAVDWWTPGFTLADLRAAVYVAKFRTIKVGVARGWTFAQHAPPADERAAVSSLGLKLYAALYGGSGVSLSAVANWLVKMPTDESSALPRRVSRFDYCQHHTFAQVEQPLAPAALDDYVFHIRKAYSGMRSHVVEDRARNAETLSVRENAMVAFSREGVFGLEWGAMSGARKSFRRAFLGIYCVLTLHCLSERVTLEKLSYLAALQAQHLPTPGAEGARSLAAMEHNRRQVMALATMLVRYRSSMASDDCGGRSVFREFFQGLRQVYHISSLKQELREELQDTLAIVESDWMEKRRQEKSRELLWKLKREELSKRKDEVTERRKRVFDIVYTAFTAVGLPFLIISNVWAMNNADLPRDVQWSNLMIGCACCSVVLFVAIYVNFNRGRSKLASIHEEEQRLNQLRLQHFGTNDEALSLLAPSATDRKQSGKTLWRLPWSRAHRTRNALRVEAHDDLLDVEQYMDALQDGRARDGDHAAVDNVYLGRPVEAYSMDILRDPAVPAAPTRRTGPASWLSRWWPSGGAQHSPAAALAPIELAPVAMEPVLGEYSGVDQPYLSPPSRDFSFDLERPVAAPPPHSSSSLLRKLRLTRGSAARTAVPAAPVAPASSSTAASLGPMMERHSLDAARERRSLDLQRDISDVSLLSGEPLRAVSMDVARPMVAPPSKGVRRKRK